MPATRHARRTNHRWLTLLSLTLGFAMVWPSASPVAAGTDSVSVQKSTDAAGLQAPGDVFHYTITVHANTAVDRLVIADGAFDYPQISVTGTALSVNGSPRACTTTRTDNVWCGLGSVSAGTTAVLTVTVKVNANVDIACDKPGQHGTEDDTALNIAKARWEENGTAFRADSTRVSVFLDCDGYDPNAEPLPTAVINSHPPTSTTSTSGTFSFTSPTATTFRCALDSGQYAACTSPKTYEHLSVGSHTFSVQAVNSVGAGKAATFEWQITNPFTDIGSTTFRDDILWLYSQGITGGCSATKFCPNASVSRGQMAAFLARALDLPATGTDFFTDDETSTFETSINRVAAAGIAFGCAANRFCPQASVSRAEMASFLARAFDLPGTSTDFFVDDEGITHETNINRVAAAGIASGCTSSRYCPTNDVTRAQMAAFLHRALT